MRFDQLFPLVERLRLEAIGNPEFVPETGAYVYREESVRVVAVLKTIRAAQGLNALKLLGEAGLFIDFAVTIRCISDCVEDVYFLMEDYPKASGNIEKFVKGFFESQITVDGYVSQTAPAVERSKIRAARVRYLHGQHDDATSKRLEKLYKTYSGYVHANRAEIMEIYGGPARNFNLSGIPSVAERQKKKRVCRDFNRLRATDHVAGFGYYGFDRLASGDSSTSRNNPSPAALGRSRLQSNPVLGRARLSKVPVFQAKTAAPNVVTSAPHGDNCSSSKSGSVPRSACDL